MNKQELIAWAKTNCVCWAGLTAEQRDFLERRKKDVGQYFGEEGKCISVGFLLIPPQPMRYNHVLRLRPDYEPEPELKWYVHPQEMTLHQWKEGHCLGWLEVTPEYADYLRKPRGEGWELRMAKDGDTVKIYNHSGELDVVIVGDLTDRGPRDRGIRWCRVKPRMVWQEYAVVPELFSDDWCIEGKHSASASYTYLDNAPRMQGFGGTKYRRPDGTLTEFLPFTNSATDDGPATPVKVRFWEPVQ